jgi:hypothetical protein
MLNKKHEANLGEAHFRELRAMVRERDEAISELSRNPKTARCGWQRMAPSSPCETTLPRLCGRFGGLSGSRGLFSVRSGWVPKRDHQARSAQDSFVARPMNDGATQLDLDTGRRCPYP